MVLTQLIHVNMLYWLVVSTPLKNISEWEGLSHILWKIKNVPNDQPGEYYESLEQWKRPKYVQATCAVVGQLSNPVQHKVNNLLANGVMSWSKIIVAMG